MTIKILAIGDTADNIFTLKKYAKKSQIHLINFPRKHDALTTTSKKGVEFFDSLLIFKQVQYIKKIKKNFDLCIVMGWAAARVAYLAGLNYIMYFVGNDITTPPFIKNPKNPGFTTPEYKLNYIERQFYKKVFDSAVACITLTTEYFQHLKKYRKDAIRLDHIFVDTELFNENIKPVELKKNKFIFLSAQRIGLGKGFDIIWKALPLCKTNFEVLQVKWFIEKNEEDKKINENLIKTKPNQVKFISLIPRAELARYFKFADAILGQMRPGIQGAIERDAAYCKKPVISYTDPEKYMIIDDKEVIPPFQPNTQDPKKLAELIDKVVNSKEYREKLVKKEFEYIKKLSTPEKVIDEWEKIFENTIKKHPTINRKSSKIRNMFEIFISKEIEKRIYLKTMKEKNERSFGEENYKKLTK